MPIIRLTSSGGPYIDYEDCRYVDVTPEELARLQALNNKFHGCLLTDVFHGGMDAEIAFVDEIIARGKATANMPAFVVFTTQDESC